MTSGPLVPRNDGFREIQSVEPTELMRPVGPGLYTVLPSQESALREYLRVLIKRKWLVAACVAGIFAAVAIASLRQTPVFEAGGRIAVNKSDSNLVTFKDSMPVMDYYDPTDLDTETRVLQSDLLALQVIRQLNLDKRAEYGGAAASKTPNLVADPLQNDSAHVSALLGGFKGSLHVALIPNTRIIEIHYRSTDPQLAANAVNTLVATYIEQNFKTKFESTMLASDWLSKQLVDLQMKVETSQEKLVRYQKQHEILGTDEKQNIITAKLDELNKELTAAESDRMQKEATFRQTQSPDSEAVTAAIVSDSEGGNTPGSALLNRLREQQATLKIQIADLSTQFGPAYPKVAQLNNQLKEIDRQFQSETRKAVERLRGQYLAAQQREDMLRGAFDKQKQEAYKLNENAIEYSLLKRDVDSNRQLYEGLLEKLKQAGVTAGLRSNNIKILDAARVPTAPVEPNIPRNLAFALILGITSGVGLAFLLESMDNTVRTTEQAQIVSALPSLGMIPLGSKSSHNGTGPKRLLPSSTEAVEMVTQVRPQSQMAESYRALRTSLLLSSLGAPPCIIMVTSARPQEGKTTTSINAAIVLAQKGVRVLLVDADLRRPGIHKTLGMGPRSGLSNVLTGSATLAQVIAPSPILPNLFVLAAGTPPPNPAELLASANMKEVLDELRAQYDHIVIDTPPTLSVTDAVVLSPRMDAIILVIRSGQTTKQALRRARDILLQVNAHVTGVLLNAVDLRSPDYYYYYEYQGKYSQYYQEDSPAGPGDEEQPRVVSGGA
jgi:polysaccharide biosynthesis transport protein